MRKIYRFLIMMVTFVFSMFSLISCQNRNQTHSVPPGESELPPILKSVDNILIWNAKVNCQYDIYCDEQKVATASDGIYIVPENRLNDTHYYVVRQGESLKSNQVTIGKDVYLDDEILNLTTKTNYVGIIENQYRKVIIGSETQSNFLLEATIKKRTSDLLIEVKNVDIEGFIYYEGYDYKSLDFAITFDVSGRCSFQGISGGNGEDYSAEEYNNKEYDAGRGNDGKKTIVVPKMLFIGNGEMKFIGGNGGNGGVGSSTTKWESDKFPGKGSDGGNGAAAVTTSYIVVNSNSQFQLIVQDGKGGLKGEPGLNGSIITGPLASMSWDDFDIGKNGDKGVSFIANKILLNGVINYV